MYFILNFVSNMNYVYLAYLLLYIQLQLSGSLTALLLAF